MEEIDTKSIESVQAALCLFGEKSDLRKTWSTSCCDEFEKKRELEDLLKDLANYKVLLESKDSAHKQALLDLDHYQQIADELSTRLKISDEREIYINDCRESRMHLDELESKMKEMYDQLAETVKIREQLSHVTMELKSTQAELLIVATELAEAKDAKLEDLTQAELMETALNMEKVKTEDLLRHVSELNETILHLKLASIEAENEKCEVLSEKDAELQLATKTVMEAQEQLQCMGEQLEMMQNLENELLDKSLFIDSLQLELQQANELHSAAERDFSNAINDINLLRADLDVKERENSDQANYVDSLKMELNQLKLELKNANEEVHRLNCDVETMTGELEKIKSELNDVSGKETEAEVELALLKSELHKGRSKIAAAEAAEERAKSEKLGAYLALQQLALEAEEAKKEIQRLKGGGGKEAEETESFSQVDEVPQIDESKTEGRDRRDYTDTHITISMEEYEALVKKAEKADQVPELVPESRYELQIYQKDLEIARVRIGEFRTRAEQAVSRAEVAEKAKAALEEQVRRWREQKERRKAAFAELREESISRETYSCKYDEAPKPYQPLGKVLNMKF